MSSLPFQSGCGQCNASSDCEWVGRWKKGTDKATQLFTLNNNKLSFFSFY